MSNPTNTWTDGRPAVSGAGHRRGEAGYRRITLALFAAGMTTFVSMYAVQAVLPALTTDFGVSAAQSTLAVSATTGLLACAIIPASVLSERFGRVPVMGWSAVLALLIGVAVGFAPSMEVLIILRALQGVALAGVPATAMAYLAEEVHGASLGAAMGRYIAGTTIGGLAGRVLASTVLDVSTWRWAMEAAAGACLVFTVLFLWLAPRSEHFRPQRIGLVTTARHLLGHLRTLDLVALFATGGLLMGAFVSAYNLIGFRLVAEPFALPQSLVGLVFVLYLSGTVSAGLAGRLADRWGRAQVMLVCEVVALIGLVITLVDALPVILVGMLLFTAGFFAAHAVASSWVGRLARAHRAEASALYLFAYYVGSSVLGALAAVV
ncbi:MAG: MFS transporter, partial [Propionibacteriales bacterium]|nr:MFS transporter [Propionibacteriales bacterium]